MSLLRAHCKFVANVNVVGSLVLAASVVSDSVLDEGRDLRSFS